VKAVPTLRFFRDHDLRVLSDDAGNFEVVAKDVVESIGATWNGAAAIAHVPEEWKGVRSVLTPGGTQHMATLKEQGLYFYLGRCDKPDALPMQMWVASEVLPSIRKTGNYSVVPLTPCQMFMASAQAMMALEQEQAVIRADVSRIETKVDELAKTQLWDSCPGNCEPITRIRKRMNARYGLPAWVINEVVWQLPLSPKILGMVRNHREEASGSQYAVYAVADITRVFEQFVAECTMETPTRASHRHIDKSFQLLRGTRSPRR
jgi:prophage antirepressor-like protein